MFDNLQEVRITENYDIDPVWVGNLQFIPRVGEYWHDKDYNLYKVIEISHQPTSVCIIVNRVLRDE